MAVRRLGWPAAAPDGVRVNDRVTRMAQELAGRLLRSALWQDALATAVTATWPACPGKRNPEEWDAVRAAVSGGECLPSAVIRARTRQMTRFLAAHGRLPAGVAELEEPPRVPAVLVLAACDKQQAVIERHEAGPARALLRVQLPLRPDPRSHRDWAWVALPLSLPPTVPAAAVLHLPTLHAQGGRVLADTAFTHAVPRAQRTGHTIALRAGLGPEHVAVGRGGACQAVCPVNAFYTTADGVVLHSKDICIGCGYCFYACPFGAPQYPRVGNFGSRGKMDKCTYCSGGPEPDGSTAEYEKYGANRLAEGKLPLCAEMCSTKSLLAGDGEVIAQIYQDRVAKRGYGSGAWGWKTAYHETLTS